MIYLRPTGWAATPAMIGVIKASRAGSAIELLREVAKFLAAARRSMRGVLAFAAQLLVIEMQRADTDLHEHVARAGNENGEAGLLSYGPVHAVLSVECG